MTRKGRPRRNYKLSLRTELLIYVPQSQKTLVTSSAALVRLKARKERLRVIRGVLRRFERVAGLGFVSHTRLPFVSAPTSTTVLP